jgi:hypothetical protein
MERGILWRAEWVGKGALRAGHLSERRAGISSTIAQLGVVLSSRRDSSGLIGGAGVGGMGGVQAVGEGPEQARHSRSRACFSILHPASPNTTAPAPIAGIEMRVYSGTYCYVPPERCIDGEPHTSHDHIPSGTSGISGGGPGARGGKGGAWEKRENKKLASSRGCATRTPTDEQENYDGPDWRPVSIIRFQSRRVRGINQHHPPAQHLHYTHDE